MIWGTCWARDRLSRSKSPCLKRVCHSKWSSELFTPELAEFVSREYVSEGNKRRRSPRNLPDNEWIKVKLGSG
jgi:hypothetical protein